MKKKIFKKFDLGEVIGAIIFLSLFIGLILLAIYYESNIDLNNSFFEDVAETMKWQQ